MVICNNILMYSLQRLCDLVFIFFKNNVLINKML